MGRRLTHGPEDFACRCAPIEPLAAAVPRRAHDLLAYFSGCRRGRLPDFGDRRRGLFDKEDRGAGIFYAFGMSGAMKRQTRKRNNNQSA